MKKYSFIILSSLLFFGNVTISKANILTPIPDNSKQIIVVIASSQDSSKAFLYKFKRDSSNNNWVKVGNQFEVIIGRRGLAWGNGLHSVNSTTNKKEGDYKSPEGIFELSKIFGFSKSNEVTNLKMPYVHISEMLECIDDKKSKHYNKIIERDKVDSVDWTTSEKMIKYKNLYDFGVIVNHNTNPVKEGSGSCIFLHYWKDTNDITSGCTAMEPKEMRNIIYWLDIDSNPILVQLSKVHYNKYKSLWNLPEILK